MAQPTYASTSLQLAIKGLYLNPSTFGNNAPPGALSIANNVVIDRPSVVATRRGYDNSFYTLPSDGVRSLFQYNNVKIMNTTDNDLHVDPLGNGVFSIYAGTYPVPDPANPESRIRGIEANKNFYFITEDGTYRLDHIGGQPRLAGAPPGLSGTSVPTGSAGFLANNTRIAYRVVFGYTDYNQQLVLGAPSSRIITVNTSGTNTNTVVTFQIPKEIQANPLDYFFQVYRGNASASLLTEPDDEMALVYEDLCNSIVTPIIAGEITINDITPVALIGAALYTNQGQNGILQSQYRPPWALDMCLFKQYAFYANTRTLHSANITLIASGASNGPDSIIAGDTITFTPTEFGGVPFTLTAVSGGNNISLGWFQVSDTGNPGLDIQITGMNIALVANAFSINDFLTAYYTSNDTDLPGQMTFTRTSLIASPFTITSSRTTCWSQSLPITSINDARANRIYYSIFNQPEAVPLVNYIEVGSANQPINRIIPLRDGVMVLKQDGVYRISNAAPPFTITPIDYNIRILAANTAAELDNMVYFLSDQGVVALSDSDAQIMSFVLDKTVIQNTSPTLFPNLKSIAWGIAYQSDRKYILNMPSTGSDTQATKQYVYNHLTQVWTNWTIGITCGLVLKADGRMYLGSQKNSAPGVDNSYLYQERKTFTNSDYADNQYTTANTTAGLTDIITIANLDLPPNISLTTGWSITQSLNGSTAIITDFYIGVSYTLLTLDVAQDWSVGDVIVYTPVYSEVQTVQLDCQEPGMNKQFSEMVYIFTDQSFSTLTASISSNTAGIPVVDILTPTIRGGWGIDPWGVTPWGGQAAGQGKIRRYVPQAIQRAGWLYINITNAQAFTAFGWSGVELYFKQTSTRQF